jgi:hypothetical protein
MFFIASSADVNVCYNCAFGKEKTNSEDKQFITFGFENVTSAVTLSRENPNGKKTANTPGLPKPVLTASDCLSAKNRLFQADQFESSHFSTNGHTLISLHCLLTV